VRLCEYRQFWSRFSVTWVFLFVYPTEHVRIQQLKINSSEEKVTEMYLLYIISLINILRISVAVHLV